MSHPRVVSLKRTSAWDVYVGRTVAGRIRGQGWGNPFNVRKHGPDAMRLYLDWLRDTYPGQRSVQQAARLLPGRVLACWCAPGPCHGEVLARLADGEQLAAIRADLLAGLAPDELPEMGDALRESFEERAAILEHDAGLPRRAAEQEALRMMAVEGQRWIREASTP